MLDLIERPLGLTFIRTDTITNESRILPDSSYIVIASVPLQLRRPLCLHSWASLHLCAVKQESSVDGSVLLSALMDSVASRRVDPSCVTAAWQTSLAVFMGFAAYGRAYQLCITVAEQTSLLPSLVRCLFLGNPQKFLAAMRNKGCCKIWSSKRGGTVSA